MTTGADKGLQHWLVQRAQGWQRWREKIGKGQNADLASGRHDPDELHDLVQGYRALARDVSVARAVLPGSRLTAYLDSLYHDLHLILHRNDEPFSERMQRLFREEIPATVRNLLGELVVVTLLFLGAGAVGWLLVHHYPELAGLFASEPMIADVQKGKLWTDGLLSIIPPSLLSISILTNNVIVAFTAFVLGAFYGLGTLYIIGMNGMMLGGVFAFVGRYELDDELFQFVLAHGVVELSIIVIAGAAGLRLGSALARPGDLPRSTAFKNAVFEAGKLMWICGPLLVVCGFVEGYISPDPSYSMALRWAVGVGLWLFMVALMSGWLWNYQHDPASQTRS